MNTKTYRFIAKKIRPRELAIFLKWILRIKRSIHKLPNNLKFYIDPLSDFGLNLLEDNEYEELMTRYIKNTLKMGDIFIDLGSNEGYFSILASKIVGQKGKVLSIEPQQRLWEIITKNTAINNANNIQLLPYAIGAIDANMIMNLYSTFNTGASTLTKNFNFKISLRKIRQKIYGKAEVIIKTLDEVVGPIEEPINLIKIDIEGYEFEALKGANKELAKGKFKNILIEIHHEALKDLNQTDDDIRNYLIQYGYKETLLSDNLILFTLKEK